MPSPPWDLVRQRRRPRPRLAQRWHSALAVLICALFALLLASGAEAQAPTADPALGRVHYGWRAYQGYVRFDRLVVWNATPGSTVGVACEVEGRGCLCPRRGYCGRRDPTASGPDFIVNVPRSGFVDLTRHVRRWRLRVGTWFGEREGGYLAIVVATCHNCDPFEEDRPCRDARPGCSATFVAKLLHLEVRRRARSGAFEVFQRTRQCEHWLAGAPDTIGCAQPCPPPEDLDFLNYCDGAGQVLPSPRFSVQASPGRSGVRISSLNVDGLPDQPPFAGPAVAVICSGRGCPFGARFFTAAQTAAGSLRVRALRRSVLPSGTVVEIRVLKASFTGRVQRYQVRGRRLVEASLCQHPARVDPEPCPPG